MQKNNFSVPRVGIAAIILKRREVLLGKRKGAHGAGTLSFPGGHLEYGENLNQAIYREVGEETGLSVGIIDDYPVAVTNDIFEKEDKHYITLYFRVRYISGQPRVMEPERCEEWRWFEWGYFPNNLFLPIKNLIAQEYNPFK